MNRTLLIVAAAVVLIFALIVAAKAQVSPLTKERHNYIFISAGKCIGLHYGASVPPGGYPSFGNRTNPEPS